jgi:hypothetical protein
VKLEPANGKMQVVFGECELEVGNEEEAQKEAPAPRMSERPAKAPSIAPASVAPTPSEPNGSGSAS